tara:strand:+ start:410 stop:709 length:300 start_codon:yes stop_codon:yes gene_type:complete
MMSQKDVEEWAAMIAQMEDSKTWHPKYNKKGDKTLPNKRGPNDLEEENDRLKFKNAKLHEYNEKITEEVIELRKIAKDYKELKEQMQQAVKQFRNKGAL